MTKELYLYEISILRPMLIVLLVAYHSFAPWCGDWPYVTNMEQSYIYSWLARLSYSFMLPLFVFISGYVWRFQREINSFQDDLMGLFVKKLKRLYIPCVFFGILYYLIFRKLLQEELVLPSYSESWSDFLLVFSGIGHLWFLPMLLWCFIMTYVITLIPIKSIQWGIVAVLSVVVHVSLPFHIGESFFYLFFFYSGYMIYPYRTDIQQRSNVKLIILSWLIFLCSFFVLTMLRMDVLACSDGDSFVMKEAKQMGDSLCILIYAALGICACLITSLYYVRTHIVSEKIKKIGENCFGVYIAQQFVLFFIYYHTMVPNILTSKVLPWIAFVITIFLSFGFSYMVRLSAFGRRLI